MVSTLLLILIICNHVFMAAMGQNTGGAPAPANQTTPSEAPASPPANQTTTSTPTSGGSRLRIAIPVSTYKEFVSITTDPDTGEITIGGYSIEVFRAVVNTALSVPPLYDLIPFAKPDGSFNGSFDDMLKAVYAQEYDGAVGDTTIRYDRSKWVDFTLPYSDTGITMMVSTRQQASNRTGIKLMPMIKGLLSAALIFCFLSALIFWFVEFRNDRSRLSQAPLASNQPGQRASNDDYWRSKYHHPSLGWNPYKSRLDCMIVSLYVQLMLVDLCFGGVGETLRAIIHTRLVIVMWFLVLLFLSSCYAASLTSLLTEQRQKRPIRTLDDLMRRRSKVGIQTGSFVPRLLIDRGFAEDQILTYDTEHEMIDMLSKGSAQGGVAAVIDETPYLKLFLSKNCNKGYNLVPSFDLHAEGFGFAFQKGSPLVQELSNGILKLMDNGQLTKIQQRTIGDLDEACEDDPDTSLDSNLLDFDTMWILFAGAIGVAVLVIILYMVYLGTTCDTIRKRFAYPCYLLPNYQESKN